MFLDRFKFWRIDRGEYQPDRAPSPPWQPQIRRLENRIALNASAELNPLGQLVIAGMGQDDYVELVRISDDRLILHDATGDVIPIANHPLGNGFESSAIRLDEIVSHRIRIHLGGGDDTVKLGPIDGFDILVAENDGNDHVEIKLSGSLVPQSGLLRVDAEQITLTSPNGLMNLGGVATRLIGDVTIEHPTGASRLVVDQRLNIDGSLILGESLSIQGVGIVDLSESEVSRDGLASNGTDVSLTIQQQGAAVWLGNFSDTGGALIDHLHIESASSVLAVGSEIDLAGDLSISGVEQSVRIDSIVQTDSLMVRAEDQVRLVSDVAAEHSISLDANHLTVEGTLSVLTDSPTSEIRFESGSDLVIDQAIITTRLTGTVHGDFSIGNSGNQIATVTELTVEGDFVLNDGDQNLRLQTVTIGGQQVHLASVGVLTLCDVQASASNVVIEAQRLEADREGCSNDASDLRSQNLVVDVQNGIGEEDPLRLEIASSLRATSQIGDIRLVLHPFDQDSPSITIETISTRDGDIEVVAFQSLDIHSASILSSPRDPEGTHHAMFQTFGSSSDLLIGQIHVADGNDVRLSAGDDILGDAASPTANVISDDLNLIAHNGTADQQASIRLVTNINDLVAQVQGDLRGDLVIEELDSLRVASSDLHTDSIVFTGNGQIILSAEDSIEVIDDMELSDEDLKGDPEIDANGTEQGRIVLVAPEVILGDGVQLHGEKLGLPLSEALSRSTLREPDFTGQENTLRIQTDRFEIGQDVELFTGQDQGTARVFASRPEALQPNELTSGTVAFFDPQSISVNVLTQALANDATGILTFDIGNVGERGLTATIDWGDSDGRRLQQIDGLAADQPYFVGYNLQADRPNAPVVSRLAITRTGQPGLQMEHLYVQEDVLDSTENGRRAATDPFQVRFAVRHHESIVVHSLSNSSATIVQHFAPDLVVRQEVVGGVLSSTDDPSTLNATVPLLESGRTAFIIPSLTIPMAFIPVRDVIPEIEVVEFVLQPDSRLETSDPLVQQGETLFVSTLSQKEFFRLRVLSPDPTGEDLIEAKKLPLEIMQSGRLQEFMRSLPDASYEIQYVMGDNDERSILLFDVRSGEPIIGETDLDEGVLRLLDLDAKERDPTDSLDEELDQKIDEDVKDDPTKEQSRTTNPAAHRFSKASRFARLRHAR